MKINWGANKPKWTENFIEAVNFACAELGLDACSIIIHFEFLALSNGFIHYGYFLHKQNKPVKIVIDKSHSEAIVIATVIHELVHWKQCLNGTLGNNNSINEPHEIEARTLEKTLFKKFNEKSV